MLFIVPFGVRAGDKFLRRCAKDDKLEKSKHVRSRIQEQNIIPQACR
jgi:hypothetical protein